MTEVPGDRIVRLAAARAGEELVLWIRLWGSAANAILTDTSGKILDAFYRRPRKNEVSGAGRSGVERRRGLSSAPCNGSAGRFYSYISTTTNNGYKLAAKMESALYSQGGTNDVESTDGGTDPDMYEQGTSLSL